MNLRKPNSNEAIKTYNRSTSVVPSSGLCTRCIDGCRGNCDIFRSSFRGREVLYPNGFGAITSGADKEYPVDYSHLNIQGYAVGAFGLPEDVEACSNTAIFTKANTETEYGWEKKVRMKVPIFTGAIGSTEIAKKNWEHLAAGAAISGISIVVGENVAGMDPEVKLDINKKIISSPEIDRRINSYRKYQTEFGEIRIQMNVEDTRLGVAEYVSSKHDLDTIELKWGQGAKCIGGEVMIPNIDKAISLKRRGYLVTPDPEDPLIRSTYNDGGLKEFERHSRVGFISKEGFLKEVDRLRDLGFKRVTLKTGAYSMVELAMAIKFCSEAKIDLLTIDGAGGGTGMSPWGMMEEWGIPTFYLQSLAYEFAERLRKKRMRIPDLAMAGGFSTEDGVYKSLAMGAPYFKAVCMGRALMIPGFVGKNIGKWIENKDLPRTVSEFGNKVEEIFTCYEEVANKFGNEMKDLPLGALGIYTYVEKFKTGLQQLMAGSRKFNIKVISRNDLMSLTEEASRVSGIPYVMDAYRREALDIIEEV